MNHSYYSVFNKYTTLVLSPHASGSQFINGKLLLISDTGCTFGKYAY